MSPELIAMLFVIAMFSGVFIIYMGLRQRSQQLEMHHRERMAMIEKGQIPLAEPTAVRQHASAYRVPRTSRSFSAGIIVVGLGLAMMTIISIAADAPAVGIGVGGAIAILGAAFIATSLLSRGGPATSSTIPPDDPTL